MEAGNGWKPHAAGTRLGTGLFKIVIHPG